MACFSRVNSGQGFAIVPAYTLFEATSIGHVDHSVDMTNAVPTPKLYFGPPCKQISCQDPQVGNPFRTGSFPTIPKAKINPGMDIDPMQGLL